MFKITSLNSFSVALKIGIGLITSKILAIFVGPSGMALVGNLRNFLTSLENISTLGFQNGIVKYTAENEKSKTEITNEFQLSETEKQVQRIAKTNPLIIDLINTFDLIDEKGGGIRIELII